jgi:hypothetical protein
MTTSESIARPALVSSGPPQARPQPCRIEPAVNILSRDSQIEIIAALTEGMAIRAVERLTGIHRDTCAWRSASGAAAPSCTIAA